MLREHNHTLKRALTDPHLFSGIGNAYSDEILHRAKLSPLTWTSRLTDEEADRLFERLARHSPSGPTGSAPKRATGSRRR